MTLTISTATYPVDGRHRDALLRAADQRLHAIKDIRPPVRCAVGGALAPSRWSARSGRSGPRAPVARRTMFLAAQRR